MKPEFHSFIHAAASIDENHTAIQQAAARQRLDGATWFRVTAVDERHRPTVEGDKLAGLWIEGWRTRPDEEAAFDPPLTPAGAPAQAAPASET